MLQPQLKVMKQWQPDLGEGKGESKGEGEMKEQGEGEDE